MYTGYCFALATSLLLLIVATLPPAYSDTSTERCTYVGEQHVLVNESQSPGITCTSLNLHGSSYYHKLDGMSTNENQMDIIHCEAASEGYQDLDLYHEVSRDGTRSSRISSGACMIGDGVTCTQVILYVNLTFYDLRNGSVIPVCAFNIRNDHNSECYCIHYLTIGYPPDDQDNKSCQPVTTEVITNDATTTKPEPGFDHQTQPAKGSPAGGYPAVTFQGAISGMVIVIVIQAVVIGIMTLVIICICKKSKPSRWRPWTKSKARDSVGYCPSSQTPQSHRTQTDHSQHCSASDDEHEADPFGNGDHHDESHKLLLQRSYSCPAGSPPSQSETVEIKFKF